MNAAAQSASKDEVPVGDKGLMPDPCVLVIFGASGDLTSRKLLPAIERLATFERIPPELVLVGVARTKMTDAAFRKFCLEATAEEKVSPQWEALVSNARYVSGAYDDAATYRDLAAVLEDCDEKHGTAGNRSFYLATPPSLFGTIATNLGKAKLNLGADEGTARLVIEKPFGWDEPSSRDLYAEIVTAFDEPHIFRIDHYLAKDTVQNLLALRFANTIFEPLWNRTWVDHIQITVAETIGVGDRGGFYETAGAMRDIVQNHVLQVLSLFLMEPPTSFHPEAIRDEKVKLLRAIRTWDTPEDIAANTVRGQYSRGGTREDLMVGYREESEVDPLSSTETFVAMRLLIDNWRWAGVPIYVRTGKRLPERVTEVAMHFLRPPQLPLFPTNSASMEPDALVVQIQPEESLSLRFGAKVPGLAFEIRKASMDFDYDAGFEEHYPEAYERVILDALRGDPTLFIRADEVTRSWRIVDPILEQWASTDVQVPFYEASTWGPREATELLTRHGHRWTRRPSD
jgi:glucose-6-phosphate 1-dehydrogenase